MHCVQNAAGLIRLRKAGHFSEVYVGAKRKACSYMRRNLQGPIRAGLGRQLRDRRMAGVMKLMSTSNIIRWNRENELEQTGSAGYHG